MKYERVFDYDLLNDIYNIKKLNEKQCINLILFFSLNYVDAYIARSIIDYFIDDPREAVSGLAMTSCGHLARMFHIFPSEKSMKRLQIVYSHSEHPNWSNVDNANDDIKFFLKKDIRNWELTKGKKSEKSCEGVFSYDLLNDIYNVKFLNESKSVDLIMFFSFNDIDAYIARSIIDYFINDPRKSVRSAAFVSCGHLARLYHILPSEQSIKYLKKIYSNPKHPNWSNVNNAKEDIKHYLKIDIRDWKPEVNKEKCKKSGA